MRIGIKKVAPNTYEIYSRWGLLDPVKILSDKLGIQLKDKLDEKHRINKELQPELYQYAITGMKENTLYNIEITIQEKDTDLPALMNCKPDWCKRLIIALKNPITTDDPPSNKS